jgi:translation initiation factor IF-3
MDFGKFLFQLNKKKAAAKKKQKQVQIKELKYRPGIEEGDYQVKLRKVLEFLEEGNKVKITIRFRGREVMHHDLGFKLIEKLQADLNETAMVEQPAKFEGKQLVMIIGPKKK